MNVGFGFLELLLLLLSGGRVNELLDLVPTDAYWRAKGLTVSVEALLGELPGPGPAPADAARIARLLRDLGADAFATREAAVRELRAIGPAAFPQLREATKSEDPEVRVRARQLLARPVAGGKAKAVRRLMAIRTLGELKARQALPALQRLVGSAEPFVADYARQAIAAIEGRPYQRPRPPAATQRHDLALLPPRCGVVAQLDIPGGAPLAFEKLLKQMPLPLPPGQDAASLVDRLTGLVLSVAERIGNVRLDRLTLGVSDDVGDDRGFVVVVARGLYDVTAVRTALAQEGLAAQQVAGVDVVAVENDFRLILCSGERLALLGGPRGQLLPVGEIVNALKRPEPTPTLEPKMMALVRSVDTAKPLWAVARVTEAYRRAAVLAAFDTLTLVGERQGDALALTLTARGSDAAKVQAAVATFNDGVKQALAQVRAMAGRVRAFAGVAEFLDSIRTRTAGATAAVTGRLRTAGSGVTLPLLFIMVARSAPVQAPMPPPNADLAPPVEVRPRQ